MVVPDRRSQPYRKGPRAPSGALTAMLRGRTAYGQNPMDVARKTAQMGSQGRSALLAALLRRS